MTDENQAEDGEESPEFNRRNVLKAAGATAITGGAMAAGSGSAAAQESDACSCFDANPLPEGCRCTKFDVESAGQVFTVAGATLRVLQPHEAGNPEEFDTLEIVGGSNLCRLALKAGSARQGESCTHWGRQVTRLTTSDNKSISNIQVVHGENCCATTSACQNCPSDLNVKYEYNSETGEFELEGDGDDNISNVEITEAKDGGEPVQVCFTTTYCRVNVTVKAGDNTYSRAFNTSSGSQQACFRGVTTTNRQGQSREHAISNFVITCPSEEA